MYYAIDRMPLGFACVVRETRESPAPVFVGDPRDRRADAAYDAAIFALGDCPAGALCYLEFARDDYSELLHRYEWAASKPAGYDSWVTRYDFLRSAIYHLRFAGRPSALPLA